MAAGMTGRHALNNTGRKLPPEHFGDDEYQDRATEAPAKKQVDQ
jgi:hypothetical protein